MEHKTLTPKGTNCLVSNINRQVVLQVIGLKSEIVTSNQGDAVVSEISDGYHKLKCYWNGSALNKIRGMKQKFNGSIVLLTNYTSTSKTTIGMDFQPLYLMTEVIGTPIPYKQFLSGDENLGSTNVIDHTKATKYQAPIIVSTSQTPQKTFVANKQNSNIQVALERIKLKDISQYQTIQELYPGLDNWTIFCRVHKLNYREFTNKKGGNTQLLEFELRDSCDWSLKATIFGDEALKQSKRMSDNQVYTFSQGVIKVDSYKTKASEKDSQYCITFTQHSLIKLSTDDSSIKKCEDTFRSIEQVKDWRVGAEIDVVGILKEIKDQTEIMNKANTESMKKRIIVICDPIKRLEMDVTLWRAQSEVDPSLLGKVVSLESFKVQEYKGSQSLGSTIKSRIVAIKGHALNAYEGSTSMSFENISSRKGEIVQSRQNQSNIQKLTHKTESMNDSEEAWSSFCVYLNKTKEKGKKWYNSCPNEKCKKAVKDNDLKCSHCQRSFDTPHVRYIMSIEVSDCLGTGSLWTAAYDDFTNVILSQVEDCPASKASRMQQEDFIELCRRCHFQQYKLTMKSTWEYAQDSNRRLKHNVVRFTPIDYAAQARANLEAIKAKQ